MTTETFCWICGAHANSREHMIKKSDLKGVFGIPNSSSPLYYHSKDYKNVPMKSLNNDRLRFSKTICSHCNNTRTQPHDVSWQVLSKYLRSVFTRTSPPMRVRANKIFRYNTKTEMLNVHLFFTKLFGCYIKEKNIPIDLAPFATSIMATKAHPELYLKFYSNGDTEGRTGMSQIETQQTQNKDIVFATWLYEVDNLIVNIMYSLPGQSRNGLTNAWHPRHNTSNLII